MVKGKAIFFIAVFLFGIFPPKSFAAKPRPPVHLFLLQNVLESEEIEIILTAKVNSDTESLELFINLPPALVLTKGKLAWKGKLQAGESHQVKIRVIGSSGVNPVIEGKAVMRLPNGSIFKQKNSIILEDVVPNRSLTPSDQHRSKQRSIFDLRKK